MASAPISSLLGRMPLDKSLTKKTTTMASAPISNFLGRMPLDTSHIYWQTHLEPDVTVFSQPHGLHPYHPIFIARRVPAHTVWTLDGLITHRDRDPIADILVADAYAITREFAEKGQFKELEAQLQLNTAWKLFRYQHGRTWVRKACEVFCGELIQVAVALGMAVELKGLRVSKVENVLGGLNSGRLPLAYEEPFVYKKKEDRNPLRYAVPFTGAIFLDEINSLVSIIQRTLNNITTEEWTKTSGDMQFVFSDDHYTVQNLQLGLIAFQGRATIGKDFDPRRLIPEGPFQVSDLHMAQFRVVVRAVLKFFVFKHVLQDKFVKERIDELSARKPFNRDTLHARIQSQLPRDFATLKKFVFLFEQTLDHAHEDFEANMLEKEFLMMEITDKIRALDLPYWRFDVEDEKDLMALHAAYYYDESEDEDFEAELCDEEDEEDQEEPLAEKQESMHKKRVRRVA